MEATGTTTSKAQHHFLTKATLLFSSLRSGTHPMMICESSCHECPYKWFRCVRYIWTLDSSSKCNTCNTRIENGQPVSDCTIYDVQFPILTCLNWSSTTPCTWIYERLRLFDDFILPYMASKTAVGDTAFLVEVEMSFFSFCCLCKWLSSFLAHWRHHKGSSWRQQQSVPGMKFHVKEEFVFCSW